MMLRRWNQFLLQPVDVVQFALLRVGLGTIISIYLIALIPLYSLHFSPEGWLATTSQLDLYHAGSWSVLFAAQSQTQAWLLLGMALVSSVAFTLGLATRLCGLIVWIGLVSLWNRNPLILDGDDAILRVMLFYLLLAPCGNAFSIDSRRQRLRQFTPVWPLRMIQIQLALVYFVSGWVKFHSPEWLNGEILQYVLLHPEYSRWDFHSLLQYSQVRTALHAVAWIVMGWEILFPVLMLFRFTRTWAIVFGLVFHGTLLLTMELRLFSLVMLILYLAWAPPPLLLRIRKDLRRLLS